MLTTQGAIAVLSFRMDTGLFGEWSLAQVGAGLTTTADMYVQAFSRERVVLAPQLTGRTLVMPKLPASGGPATGSPPASPVQALSGFVKFSSLCVLASPLVGVTHRKLIKV